MIKKHLQILDKPVNLKVGDKIIIKNNLEEELKKYGVENVDLFVKKFKGKTKRVILVYFDKENDTDIYWVTIEENFDIPITACQKIN